MDKYFQPAKIITHTVLNLFACSRSRTKGTIVLETPEIQSQKSINSLEFVITTNPLAELPSNEEMTTLSNPIGRVSNVSISSNDRWLGQKILEVTLATVTLRSLSPTATEKDVEKLYHDFIRTFRYEDCLKELFNQTELSEADANFRDLLLSKIGHNHRQAQISGSVPLIIDLERYIDDRRRLQNEKFIKQESDLECTPEARALSDPQTSLISPLEASIAISPNQNGTFHKPCLKFGQDTEPTPLPAYTTRLKEYADKNGISPDYTEYQTQFQPPMFNGKVTLGELEAIGRDRSNKKDARHEASKALWNLLQ